MSKSCLPPAVDRRPTSSFLSDDPALFASGGGLYGRSPGVSNAFLEKNRAGMIFFGGASKNRRNPPSGFRDREENQNR
jgi:hypothetical protein